MTRRPIERWDGLTAAQLQRRWDRPEVRLFGKIESTNDLARELAEAGAPSGAVVLCREQTRGRGRGGHGWYSPPDAGVYLSMIFRPRGLSHTAPVSVLAGLGVAVRLDQAFPGLRPRLKWPNDIVVDGRKLAGVLAEAVWADGTPRYLVVGVGLNVRPVRASAPAGVKEGAIAIDSVLEGEARLVEAADAVVDGLDSFVADAPPVLSADRLAMADRYDWLRDRRATVMPAGEERPASGICVGIAPDGALLFRPDRGALRRVQDGSVEVTR